VAREYGELDQAITNLQGLVETRFAEAIERGFDFSKDYRVLNELGRSLYERARQERGAAHQAQRAAYLSRAKEWLHKALVIDPENLSAHYNLALVFSELGDTQAAAEHRRLHEQYRPDDQAIEQAVSAHRRANPAADHAAEPTAIYLLEPPLTAADRTAQDSR
jgi:tetratricopeptide (TPR) repeat protein